MHLVDFYDLKYVLKKLIFNYILFQIEMALFTRTVARSTSALSMTTRNFVGITATEGVLPTQVFLDGHLTAYTQSAPKVC